MTYTTAIISTLVAWVIGLVLDANIDFGDPLGFLCFRVLFPVLAMGLCILKALKNNEKK
ncbi:hypothetical protein [Ruthenibacterium lactatiformans]|uniref:hypothetical protein n=1 Tax=Ruthenibacterium lactatiformans TaxID=1550024 RepID=UPI001968670F|nr:hypothetical protein [Ruthenibacterium lactatiformans]MBN3010056.1 hypothetical protein [Ruthenibacterium lactatiformans]